MLTTRQISPFFRALAKQTTAVKVASIAFGLGLTFVLGYLTNRTSSVADQISVSTNELQKVALLQSEKWLWQVMFIFLILQIIMAIVFALTPTTPAEAIDLINKLDLENDDLVRSANSLKNQRDKFLHTLHSSTQSLAIVSGFLMRDTESSQKETIATCKKCVETDLESILASFILQKNYVFNYKDDNVLHNMAVYLWNKTNQQLEAIWRVHHNNLTTQGKGRPWKQGQGHVGLCFQDAKLIATPDLPSTGLFEMSEQDRSQYRSAFSVPIFGENNNPVGVFVITSSELGQFGGVEAGSGVVGGSRSIDDKVKETMETISQLLSLYFTYNQNEVSQKST